MIRRWGMVEYWATESDLPNSCHVTSLHGWVRCQLRGCRRRRKECWMLPEHYTLHIHGPVLLRFRRLWRCRSTDQTFPRWHFCWHCCLANCKFSTAVHHLCLPVCHPKYLEGHTLLDTFNLSSKPVSEASTFKTSISKPVVDSVAPSSTFSITGRPMDRRGSRADAKNTPSPSPTITCSDPTNVGDSYTKSGGQKQISNVLMCDSTTNCQQSYAQSVTVTSTLTVQNGTTLTITGGETVGFEEDCKTYDEIKKCGLMEYSRHFQKLSGVQPLSVSRNANFHLGFKYDCKWSKFYSYRQSSQSNLDR